MPSQILKEFHVITNFWLTRRSCNKLSDAVSRKDPLFDQLTFFYVHNQRDFGKLKKKIDYWLSLERSETIFSLAGYIYHISENFKKAKRYFLKSIQINSKNLDNWIDLAFALRHLGEHEISDVILFDFDYVIYYYNYFDLRKSSYAQVKKMILKIKQQLKY